MALSQTDPNLSINGTGSAAGGLYRQIKIKGVGNVGGDVQCQTYSAMGVSEVEGSLTAQKIVIKGQTDIRGDMKAKTIDMHGAVTVEGDCSSETFQASGAFTVDGLLNADSVDIRLHGPSQVDEIGGTTIQIRRGRWRFLNSHELTVNVIEGDTIDIENTKAQVVRGTNVTIGRGCDIELVECSGKLRVAPGSKVRQQNPD